MNKELQNKYITVEKAKELCIEAHKGRWRKGTIPMPDRYKKEWNTLMRTQEPQSNEDLEEFFILEDGNRAYYDYYKTKEFVIQQPYSSHPIAVAEMMNTDEEKIVAYLHDVFEDCDGWGLGRIMDNSRFYIINRNKLQEYDISERVHFALDSLTKEKHVPYKDYIKNIIDSYKYYTNSLPIKVKIADMFHNMSDNPSERQKTKYAKGLKLLLGAL